MFYSYPDSLLSHTYAASLFPASLTSISRRIPYWSTHYLVQGRYYKLSGHRQIFLLIYIFHNFYQLTNVNFILLIPNVLQKTFKINLHRIIFCPYICINGNDNNKYHTLKISIMTTIQKAVLAGVKMYNENITDRYQFDIEWYGLDNLVSSLGMYYVSKIGRKYRASCGYSGDTFTFVGSKADAYKFGAIMVLNSDEYTRTLTEISVNVD